MNLSCQTTLKNMISFFFSPKKYLCLSVTGQFKDLKYVIPKVGLAFKQLLFIKLLFDPAILSIGTTLVMNNLNNDWLISFQNDFIISFKHLAMI